MIKSELNKRDISALLYISGMAVLIFRATVMKIMDGELTELIAVVTMLALIASCSFYLRSKRRSAAWLLLIFPLNVLAGIVYYLLEDHSELKDDWSPYD